MRAYLYVGLLAVGIAIGFLACKGLTQWGAVRQAEQGAVAVERVAKSKATIGIQYAKIDRAAVKITGDCDNRNTSAAVDKLLPY